MAFYITLPSNACMDLYPNNTLQNFTVKISNSIQLHGAYEVALVEVLYPNLFRTFFGILNIISYDNDNEQEYCIQLFTYENKKLSSQIDLINKQISDVTGVNKIFFELDKHNFRIKIAQNFALELSDKIVHDLKLDDKKFIKTFELLRAQIKIPPFN